MTERPQSPRETPSTEEQIIIAIDDGESMRRVWIGRESRRGSAWPGQNPGRPVERTQIDPHLNDEEWRTSPSDVASPCHYCTCVPGVLPHLLDRHPKRLI